MSTTETEFDTTSPEAIAALIGKAADDLEELTTWANDEYADVTGTIQDHDTTTATTIYVDLGQFGQHDVELDEIDVNLYREECGSLRVEPCNVLQEGPLDVETLQAMGSSLRHLAHRISALGGAVAVEPGYPEEARVAYMLAAAARDWAGTEKAAEHVLAVALTIAREARPPKPNVLAAFDPAEVEEADGGEAHDGSARSEFDAPAPVEF